MDEKDLLQAILDAQLDSPEGEDDAMTTAELYEKTGIYVGRLREIIKRLMDKGHMEVIWVYRDELRTPLTGTRSKRPGYRLTEKGKEAIKEQSGV